MLRRRTLPKGDFFRDLLLAQVDLFARFERTKAEAMAIEQMLDLVDAGDCELEPTLYATLEARLGKLDSGNWALRGARSKLRSLEGKALALLTEYAKDGDGLLLRSATFAGEAANALASEGELARLAGELRARARAAGLLFGRVAPVDHQSTGWENLFSAPPRQFQVDRGRIELTSTPPAGLLDPKLVVRGEYELRGRLQRGAEPSIGAAWGWIVGGTSETGAVVVGLAADGSVGIWEIRRRSGAARPKRVATFALDPALAADEDALLAIRVQPGGELEIKVGLRAPIHARSPLELPPERLIGVFVRDGTLVMTDPVVELFP
jgi:hypothetical protein